MICVKMQQPFDVFFNILAIKISGLIKTSFHKIVT